MQCKKCHAPMPFVASRCNNCHQKTGYDGYHKKFIPDDMYDNKTFQVQTDDEKSRIRKKYIDNLKEYKELDKMWENIPEYDIRFLRALYLIVPIIAMVIAIFAPKFINQTFGTNYSTGQSMVGLMVFLFLFVIAIFCACKLKEQKRYQYINKVKLHEKEVKIHSEKLIYYANENIFGYVTLDHTNTYKDSDGYRSSTDYYVYYEVDKRDIVSIGYDSYFAEYVLTLRHPIYMDYSLEPMKEFRVQDIFDDYVLSNALSCSLPPKNMNF